MFGIGMPELLVIAGLALLLIGPKKLPDLAKSIGRTLGELRKAADDLKGSISEEINTIKDDLPNQAELQDALKKEFLGAEDKKEEASKKVGAGKKTGAGRNAGASKHEGAAGKKKNPAG
jgi:Tat protein translocase TatB subunit